MCSSDLDLNVRPDTIKLLEENVGRTPLYDINHSKILFDPPARQIEKEAVKLTLFADDPKDLENPKDSTKNY